MNIFKIKEGNKYQDLSPKMALSLKHNRGTSTSLSTVELSFIKPKVAKVYVHLQWCFSDAGLVILCSYADPATELYEFVSALLFIQQVCNEIL